MRESALSGIFPAHQVSFHMSCFEWGKWAWLRHTYYPHQQHPNWLLSSVLNRCIYNIDDRQLNKYKDEVTKVEKTLKTSETTLNQVVQRTVDFFTNSQYMHQVQNFRLINFIYTQCKRTHKLASLSAQLIQIIFCSKFTLMMNNDNARFDLFLAVFQFRNAVYQRPPL